MARRDPGIASRCGPLPTALVGVLALFAALRISDWPAHWHSRRV